MKERITLMHKHKAEKTARFINFVIDLFTFYLVFLVGAMISFIITDVANPEAEVFESAANINPVLDRLITGFFMVLYYFFVEWLTGGRSLGKLITGTVVLDEWGEKPTMGTFIKRNLCRLIPFDAFSFLGNRGWHDSVSDTFVVRKKTFEADLKQLTSLDKHSPLSTLE